MLLSKVLALSLAVFLLTSHGARAQDDEADEYEDMNRAHLVVRKSIVGGEPNGDTGGLLLVAGRNVTIVVDIFNAGSASARDVKITDTLPEGSKLLSGSVSTTIRTIAEGSSAQNTYTISFTTGGSGMALPLASVSYLAEEGATQVGYSSTHGVYVMTPVEQITRHALIVGTYVSLGIARSPSDWRNIAIILGLVGALLGGNWLYKASSSATVSRKRVRALQELEKQD